MPAASHERGEQVVGAAQPAGDVGADQHLVLALRLEVEEVVEARDRLQVAGGHAPSPRPPGRSPPGCTSRSGAAPPTAPGSRPSASRDSASSPGGSPGRARAGTSTSAGSGTGAGSRVGLARLLGDLDHLDLVGGQSRPSSHLLVIGHRRAARARRGCGRGRPARGASRFGSSGLTGRSLPGSGRASPGSGSGRRRSRRRTCRGTPAG